MKQKRIYTTTLRLNLADEDDRRAFAYLRNMDKKRYRSYSKAIVAAINSYFERQEHMANDPYLETREQEDAFLRRIMETIEQGLRYAPVGMLPFTSSAAQATPSVEDDEDISAALDFADGF